VEEAEAPEYGVSEKRESQNVKGDVEQRRRGRSELRDAQHHLFGHTVWRAGRAGAPKRLSAPWMNARSS